MEELRHSQPPRPRSNDWMRVRYVALYCALAGLLVWRWIPPSTARWQDQTAAQSGWADERTCADCHEQADDFARTGHARTLGSAASDDSVELLRHLNVAAEPLREGLSIETGGSAPVAAWNVGGEQRKAVLNWCFGSGRHARTWVGLLSDSWGATDALEFRWTWYAERSGFDVTPGQPKSPDPGHFGGLGVLYDHPKTRRCFACHATQVTMSEGRLSPHGLIPGVNCQRCHGPRQQHIDSAGEIRGGDLRSESQLESVHRCAECHRRAEEQNPEDIRADNPEIARFQPVGLVQSACFRGAPEMTCLSCHDPHRPLEDQDSLGIWQCVQCHNSAVNKGGDCSAGQQDDCIKCHMPKVQGNSPLQFTDHWIRVRAAVQAP
jgi:hypothetical protein